MLLTSELSFNPLEFTGRKTGHIYKAGDLVLSGYAPTGLRHHDGYNWITDKIYGYAIFKCIYVYVYLNAPVKFTECVYACGGFGLKATEQNIWT